jgi:hypothetical protein
MKQAIVFSLSLLFAAFMQPALAQKQETINGNGKLVTVDVPVQSFTALDASGIYELKLTQGNSESVKVEADENLQSYFSIHNNGGTLVIDTKGLNNKNLHVKNKMRVYVTFKNLKTIELKTVCNISSSNDLSFEELDLTNRSVGNVDLDLKATRLNLENSSVGNVNLSGQAENAVMKNSGVGAAEVNATKGLKVKDSFLGKVKNRGAATARKMNKVVI